MLVSYRWVETTAAVLVERSALRNRARTFASQQLPSAELSSQHQPQQQRQSSQANFCATYVQDAEQLLQRLLWSAYRM